MPQTQSYDISSWSKRNMWRLPSGELAVRPGLRRIGDLAGSGNLFAPGAFTVRNDFAGGEVWHYFVKYKDAASSSRVTKLLIFDENLATIVDFTINTNRVPRAITYGIVQGQIIIGSPDFPPLHGLVGNGVHLAKSVASDDTTTTAIPLPTSCIVTSWVGSRIVYASGRSIFVSDPVTADGGDPRTIVGENQCELPGVIYGLHEAAGGMLVAVTDAGVYGLDSSAASTSEIGQGGADWRLLNHHRVSGYSQSCVVRGRVWALTQRGMMLVDIENDAEIVLSEPMQSIGIGSGRYALEDFRSARIIAGEPGPIVCSDTLGAVVVVDLAGPDGPFLSWWSTADFAASGTAYGKNSFGGVLQDVDGEPLFVGMHAIYRLAGDFDGDSTLTNTVTFPTGSVRGSIAAPPNVSQSILSVWTAAANGGGTPAVYAGARGQVNKFTPAPDDNGIRIGTDAWGTTTKGYTVSPLQGDRVQFGVNPAPANELSFEIGADGGLVRVSPYVTVDFSDSAPTRPRNSG